MHYILINATHENYHNVKFQVPAFIKFIIKFLIRGRAMQKIQFGKNSFNINFILKFFDCVVGLFSDNFCFNFSENLTFQVITVKISNIVMLTVKLTDLLFTLKLV